MQDALEPVPSAGVAPRAVPISAVMNTTAPMNSAASNSAAPEQNVAHWVRLHEQGYFRNHPWYKDRLHDLGVAEVMQRLDLQPTHTLLEVGCGYGRLLWHLSPHVAQVIGIDLHEEPLTEGRELLRARRAAGGRGEGKGRLGECGTAEFLVGNGLNLDVLPDGCVDRVVAFTVLQHMSREGVVTYLREMRRVLKPGGQVLVNFHDERNARRVVLDRPGEQSSTTSAAQIVAMADEACVTIESLDRQSLDHLYPGRGYQWWWLRCS